MLEMVVEKCVRTGSWSKVGGIIVGKFYPNTSKCCFRSFSEEYDHVVVHVYFYHQHFDTIAIRVRRSHSAIYFLFNEPIIVV